MKEITASHIILNISSVKDSKQFLSLPNDPRTASHTLAYFDLFKTMNVNIIWWNLDSKKKKPETYTSLLINWDLET